MLVVGLSPNFFHAITILLSLFSIKKVMVKVWTGYCVGKGVNFFRAITILLQEPGGYNKAVLSKQ